FEGRNDRVRRDAGDEQRVAVGRRVAHCHRADHPRRADAVDRHDRLVVEVLRRVLADVAAREIRVAAGGERDDESDRLRRIALTERLGRDQRERCGKREPNHLAPSLSNRGRVYRRPPRFDMLAPMTSAPMPPGAVTGPPVWYGRDLATRERDWIYQLSTAEIAEIDAAVHLFKASARSLAGITPEDFPLPSFGAALRQLGAELLAGRGFFMLRGFPVDDYTRDEQAIAYMGIGSYFGPPRSQNAKGHLLGPVKDLRLHIADPNAPRPSPRTPPTPHPRRRLDSPTASVDVVALLCLKTARSGGESFVASSATVYNEIHARRPALLPALFEPFATDRRGEVPEEMKP